MKIEPTPIVRSVDAEDESRMRAFIAGTIGKEKTALKDWIQIGKWLLPKKTSLQQPEYSALINRLGLSQQRANEAYRMADYERITASGALDKCESKNDALRLIAEKPEPIPTDPGDAYEGEVPAPSPKKPGPILCARCARVGTIKDCPNCKEARKGTKTTPSTPAPPAVPPKPAEPEPLPIDMEGHVLPDALIEVFATVDKFKELDTLCRQLQSGIDEVSKLPGGEQLRPRLKATGSEEKKINKSDHLNELKRDVKFTRPWSICPWCKAKGCAKCNSTKWVSKLTWDAIDEETKARLK